jgi:GST-like protein
VIELYFWPTPNGKKVTILLEEANIPYRLIPVNITAGDQLKPEFLALNPNHRMPVMVDPEPIARGEPLVVFESGAILMYLAEKAAKFWPQDQARKYAVVKWLMWQMANFGAKVGEFNHFNRLADTQGDQRYALRRYGDETNRLYGVLNWALYSGEYVAGDFYSIADMAIFPWASNWQTHGQDLDEFPHVRRWLENMGARPGVQRGMDVDKGHPEFTVDITKFSPEERERFRALMFNQRAIPTPDKARSADA